MLCKHCNCDSKLVCSSCGAVVDEAELKAELLSELVEVRPLSLEYYLRKEQDDIIDHAVFDKVLPFVRSSSGMILLHFISHLKGASNVAWEKGFTVPQLMTMTGIKSTGTMSEALAELSVGRRASNTRPGITGWDLVKRANQGKKSRYIDGNRWVLNLDKVLEGEQYPLFHPGGQGRYVRLHPKVIREFLPTLTPDQGIIFLFIYRLTLGFNKEKDTITMNYFTGERRTTEDEPIPPEPHHRSGLRSRQGVKSIVGQLVRKGIIFVEEGDDPRNGRIYSLNPASFLIIESRARITEVTRKDNTVTRNDNAVTRNDNAVTRNDNAVTRNTTPPNFVLNPTDLNENSLNKKNEISILNPPAKTDSAPLYELTELLSNTETTDGMDKLPLSEQAKPTSQDTNGLEKLTREKRQDILTKDFGLRSTTAINKALDYLDQGMMTDGHIQLALQHKADYPLCGPGIYADYFTMKVKNGVVCGLRPMSEAEMNELDPAPNSPPPTNGHGAAPPPSPTPSYTNGHGRTTAPPAPTVEADYLEAWADAKRMLKPAWGTRATMVASITPS